ncbi:conserved Plasmodium protein, unknown function [Plasmodium knowlesi strain H]|uniref:RSE1/DDB1/CPSF1 C-terminal domain-containing protein n=2 Tax=Plasmodium knowlesi TaxID=5850 RepID=A0A679L291_PLAKH|nr:conserved Plasmodium protein, unknown function [Plasmodium knowlesi strain H]OTN67056.1 Uncharacterized protein PKNOH_S07457900 [Plasmodium knowlesi]CAA9988704.1 conserved Plasmodium protein, unknown function [Plasmodium knowlesi strain H]VVS78178.1 conserved Plasmodium protein, unknown function [Plasmodium knowlesi strain H]
MINLQVHQLRSPSEADHCECGNLLREKSLEFVLLKNRNLSIYTYQRKRKKVFLIYETKLNAPVVKLVILKGVFLRKNKERISGVLLVYKGMQFVLYRFNRHLNTLVVVLKHSFLKKTNFQPLFYSLPISVNYVHGFDKGGGSAAGKEIRIGGRKPITGMTRRRRFRLTPKRLKGYMRGGLRPGGELPDEEVPTEKRKGKEKGKSLRRKETSVGHSTKSEHNSQSGINEEIYFNLYGENGNGDNMEDPFCLNRSIPEDINIGGIHQNTLGIIKNGQAKRKKRNLNFCEFVVSFSNDFKTIYFLFYSSRRRKKNDMDPTCAGEMRTTYFGKGLYLFNVLKVSLQDLYRHFIFIKKIFFHGGNMHVLLQNEPINVGHAPMEELSLKLLILRQEDHKFDANKLMKGFPNDIIDLLRVKELLICLCQDYLYVINMKRNQKVVYIFKKSCYTNGVLHLQKKESLFCDCTDFNLRFKESSSNMFYMKGKLFILTRRCIVEGTLSWDHNNLVNLIKWRKVHRFKYDLAKSSVYFFRRRVHFVCCYNGICGRADVDLLVRRSRGRRIRGGPDGGSGEGFTRKRKSAPSAHPAKRKKLQNGEKGDVVSSTEEMTPDMDVLSANGNPTIASVPVLSTRRDRRRATRKVRPNDNFLMDLMIYLNKNPTVNEHTKGLNHSKYDFLFQKYKKKIKILEGNYSLINSQGGVEYVSPLFILKRRKKKQQEKIAPSTPMAKRNNPHKNDIITLVDKISAKGMLTDLIKSNEEPNFINNSSYFALIGNKKYSAVEKFFFKVPFSTLLNVSFKGARVRSVCATEGGRQNQIGQYVMVNLEGWKAEEDDEQIISKGRSNVLIRRSFLLCVDNINTWREKKGTIRKIIPLNRKEEKLVGESTNNLLNSSNMGNYPTKILQNKYRSKVIYTLRGESLQGESCDQVECPPRGIAKADILLAFFRFYPFVHYSNRDVKRYLEWKGSNSGADHLLGRENASDQRSSDIEINLKEKYIQFFLMEKNKNTHLSMEGNCICLLRFKSLLVQVCRKEIHVSHYANTCMILRSIYLEDPIVECKLIRMFLILRHDSGNCSVYTFHVDAVTDLLLRVREVTSLLNMCLLRCLDVDKGEEEINLLQFATFIMEGALKAGESSLWNCTDTKEEDLLSLFRTQTPDMFCKIVHRMGGSNEREILSLYTQLNNVRCISTVKRKAQSFLAFLDDANSTIRIFHLEKKRTFFISNSLLAVPKYVYNAKWSKREEITERGGDEPREELLLDTYKLEEIINVLLFPLGPNYILIVFLTGRPMLIYKSVGEIRSMRRLKFQVVTHRYIYPLLSNVHFVKDPSGENVDLVTISRDKTEVNNGFFLHIDGRKRARTRTDKVGFEGNEKKKKKKMFSKCIVGYPHIDITKVDLSRVSGNQEEQIYQKLRAYNTSFPPLLLSNCKGKLFVHRCGGEGQVASQGQPKGIVKIAHNAYLRVDSTSLRIVTIGEEENVFAVGPEQTGLNDLRQCEYQLNRDVARTLSEISPPLEVICHHSNVEKVQVHNEMFFLKNLPPNKFSFNDDMVSKLFLSYPYIYKIAISHFEYLLKRRKRCENGEQNGEQKGGEEKTIAEMEKKENHSVPTNEQGKAPKGDPPLGQQVSHGDPFFHRVTRGKIICVVVRTKYEEYHCLKKLQKRRLNLQKDELRNNVTYAGEEEVQCVPNVHLQDIINNQYTHKLKGFLPGNDKEEGVTTRNDEDIMIKNNKLICSAKSNAKFSKLLLLHECSSKRVFGYYTFEHAEEIHSVSFGFLHGKEYIYVSTSINIGERVETQGNIYVFDISGVFARVGEDSTMEGEVTTDGKEVIGEGEAESPPPSGKRKKGKLSVYLKKTYNSSVTQIHPFYMHSEGFTNGGLDSALESLILSNGGEMKRYGKYSGRSEHEELFLQEEEIPYPHERSITACRENRKKRNMDPNVHCNILHCMNSKLFIHEVSENDFTKGAFLENNFFISDIKILKNFFIVADLHRGIFISMYNYEQQYDSRSIIPIAKPFFSSNLNVLCCQYIVLDSLMCILAMDVFNNLLIFSFQNYQSVDTLYIFNFFNFCRRILKYVNAVHPHRRSNSALSISNDGSIHLFHPLSTKSFTFLRETYNVVRTALFPHLAINAHEDLTPDVFTQSVKLNLHRKTDSFSIKNVLFDDMLRQLPFYSAQVLQELFLKRANLLDHITIGEFLIELSSLNER